MCTESPGRETIHLPGYIRTYDESLVNVTRLLADAKQGTPKCDLAASKTLDIRTGQIARASALVC